MSKLVAINVGKETCRFLLADVTKGEIRLLRNGVAMAGDALGDEPLHLQLGQVLATQLEEAEAAGAEAIVSIRRADFEVRSFDLPPASDAELAALLEVQLLADGGAAGEQVVIDFVPRRGDPAEPRQV